MDVNDTVVQNETSSIWFWDVDTKVCLPTFTNLQTNSMTFACEEHSYWWGIGTLIFIYMPSVNVISALISPKIAGVMCFFWGLIIVGLTLLFVFYPYQWLLNFEIAYYEENGLFPWNTGYHEAFNIAFMFFVIFGSVIFAFGIIQLFSGTEEKKYNWLTTVVNSFISSLTEVFNNKKLIFLIFPFLLILSPLFLLLIKFLAIVKPKNDLIQNQSRYCSLGESILEATPQLCLQLYVIFNSMSPSWKQIFSIITSSLTLGLPNMEKFLNYPDFQLKSFAKYFLIFFLNSVFRVSSLSLITTFFHTYTFLIFFIVIVIEMTMILILLPIYKLYNEEDLQLQWIECGFLSWLTMTNFDNTKAAVMLRMASTYFIFFLYSAFLLSITTICAINPNIVILSSFGIQELFAEVIVDWSQLEILPYLPLMVGIIIFIGAGSMILDLFGVWKHHQQLDHLGFWSDYHPVIHGGWNYFRNRNYQESLV